MGSSTKLLKEYIRTVKTTKPRRKRWVFDFDYTLVRTDACTHVTNSVGKKFDLDPHEFAIYERQPGDVFDYTDFEKLINPRPIKWMNRILHNVCEHHGHEAALVLSARSYSDPIRQYLVGVGLADVEVATLNTPAPEAKAAYVSELIETEDLEEVEFFDDSHKNVAAVAALRAKHPNVAIFSRHVIHNRINRCLS